MTINILKRDLVDYYTIMKLSSRKIAKIYNCCQKTILDRMIEYDIPRRTKSESLKGRKFTEKHKNNISKGTKGKNKGEKCYNWKGNEADYGTLHAYIRKYKPKPKTCEICGKSNKLELSCKDHIYTRNIKDYQYICRNCHVKYDIKNNDKYKKTNKL